jgi:hypothetical protein
MGNAGPVAVPCIPRGPDHILLSTHQPQDRITLPASLATGSAPAKRGRYRALDSDGIAAAGEQLTQGAPAARGGRACSPR